MKRLFIICWILSVYASSSVAGEGTVDHQIEAWVDPEQGSIRVIDRITLPHPVDSFEFTLHADLRTAVETPGAELRHTGSHDGYVPTRGYRVRFAHPSRQVDLSYEGAIHHTLDSLRDEYAGGRESTPGLISPKGVFLAGSSAWYPYTGNERLSFSLTAHLPEGWMAVSQGSNPAGEAWIETNPQDDIYLIAAPYTVYKRATPLASAQVYLRRPDDELAERYLAATEQYLDLFSRLIGSYPYDKFALVENFWESGYGMPSFTLLGPRVIRLPFILHSSFPHEILHNWWGNSVYIDYESGNWAEGLTAYLADHLIKELRGSGASYRRDTLQSYADYVDNSRDFPLNRFRGRHGQVSQAVGYGKTAMMFHMLRLKLGDELFLKGLRRFYGEQKFRTAAFSDIRSAFEAVSGEDLAPFFTQWTTRTGAPQLAIEEPTVAVDGGKHHLRFSLVQTQASEPFDLAIPVFIQVEGEDVARQESAHMRKRSLTVDLALDRKPLGIMVDPRFDLFRRLDPSEIPLSLGKLFAADKLTIALPSDAPAPLKAAYREIAGQWAAHGKDVRVLWDHEIAELPSGALWIFGAANKVLGRLDTSAVGPITFTDRAIEVDKDIYPYDRFSFALTLSETGPKRKPVGWLNIHSPDAASGFARKIVHYRKYSYALFEGEGPTNVKKGQWPLVDSTLTVRLDTEALTPETVIPKRPPLANY